MKDLQKIIDDAPEASSASQFVEWYGQRLGHSPQLILAHKAILELQEQNEELKGIIGGIIQIKDLGGYLGEYLFEMGSTIDELIK